MVKFSLDLVNSEPSPSSPRCLPLRHVSTFDYSINLYWERKAVSVIVLFTSVNPPLCSHHCWAAGGFFSFSFPSFLFAPQHGYFLNFELHSRQLRSVSFRALLRHCSVFLQTWAIPRCCFQRWDVISLPARPRAVVMAAELLSGSSIPCSHIAVSRFSRVKGGILSFPPQAYHVAVASGYKQGDSSRVWRQQDVDFAFVGERKDVIVSPEGLIHVTTLRSFTGGRKTIFHGKK